MRVRDLFAGAGGWDIAALRLGWHVDGWEIMPEARATRAEARLHTAGFDVTKVRGEDGGYDIEIASPPCQTFSMSGKGSGRRDLDKVLAGVRAYARGEVHDASDFADPRTALVLDPLRVLLESGAPYAAWEQVPAVLPVWEACAEVLRERGYQAAARILNAEQYGVPQTRRRAVMMARRDGKPLHFPAPTHSQFHSRTPERLDENVKPWVSMAEALGWGMTARPSMTVCGGGTDTGGAEPFGNGARIGIRKEMQEGRWEFRNTWQLKSRRDSDSRVEQFGERQNRNIDQPGPSFTAETHRWDWTLRNSKMPNSADRNAGQPDGEIRARLTLQEAAVLQTFPADFPFFGAKGKQFLQVGNAIPPLLAEAILRALVS